MNYSLLDILLIGAIPIIIICIIMISFFDVRIFSFHEYKNGDEGYKYSYNRLAISIMKGIIEMIFIPTFISVLLDRNNNFWVLALLILYIVAWTILTVYDFRLSKTYEYRKYMKENKLKEKKIKSLNPFWLLIFGFVIFIIAIISYYAYCIHFKVSLDLMNSMKLLIIILFISMVLLISNNKVRIDNNYINTKNIKIWCTVSILLAVGLLYIRSNFQAKISPTITTTSNDGRKKPNGLDDLKKSNHKLEVKLEQEEKMSLQNQKYLKKLVKENREININIKKITNNKSTNNTTIARIIKNNPHAPTKPPYQNPRGKLPDTGEAKDFWQW